MPGLLQARLLWGEPFFKVAPPGELYLPTSWQHFIHILFIVEEGAPVVSGGEIDCELGDVLLVDGLVVEAGQESLKQTLVLYLALETDEGLGAL